MIRSLMISMQFMTIIPVRVRGNVTEEDMAKSAPLFPVVGAVQGLLALGGAFLFLKFFSSGITGALTIALMTLISGGFHLDGLMDTFDALAVKSSDNRQTDREKRLSVMKDSRAGAIGVVAAVILLLLKFQCIASLLDANFRFLYLMPVMPKWAMVVSLYYGSPARRQGLGKVFADRLGGREAALAILALAAVLIFFDSAAGTGPAGSRYLLYGMLIISASVFSLVSVAFFNRKFGGITGDTLGATSEATEILTLLVIILWSRLSI